MLSVHNSGEEYLRSGGLGKPGWKSECGRRTRASLGAGRDFWWHSGGWGVRRLLSALTLLPTSYAALSKLLNRKRRRQHLQSGGLKEEASGSDTTALGDAGEPE